MGACEKIGTFEQVVELPPMLIFDVSQSATTARAAARDQNPPHG
jgi:hypothetical protein